MQRLFKKKNQPNDHVVPAVPEEQPFKEPTGRKRRPRKSVDEVNSGSRDAMKRATMIREREAKIDTRPWYEQAWDFCCCSSAFWHLQYCKTIIGSTLCDTRDSPRYEKAVAEGKNVTIKLELPEGAVLLRLDDQEVQPEDLERLQYRVDTEGIIVDAWYG